jgi:hypothetical protein
MMREVHSGAPEEPLTWSETERRHRILDVVDARAAYESAKESVIKRVPPAARSSVRFSAWPASANSGPLSDRSEIDQLSPSLWRVRGKVEWKVARENEKPVQERFEADLRHGPADDKWHLIDTEWLDSSWMPDKD